MPQGTCTALRNETRLATVWPSVGAWPAGRLAGALIGNRVGFGPFTLGKLLALVALPIGLAVYAWRLMPFFARRYTLTSQRVRIERGLRPAVAEAVPLDGFDAIEVVVLPGQEWLRAGDVIFRQEGREVLRLAGVPLPETFRQMCLKARTALVSVRQVLQEQGAACG